MEQPAELEWDLRNRAVGNGPMLITDVRVVSGLRKRMSLFAGNNTKALRDDRAPCWQLTLGRFRKEKLFVL